MAIVVTRAVVSAMAFEDSTRVTFANPHAISPHNSYPNKITSFTPIDSSGASLSFTSAEGNCIRYGDLVVAWGAVVYPVTASGASCAIGGLLYTVRSAASAQGGMVTYTTEATAASALPFAGTTTVDIRNTTGGVLTNATLSGDTVYFCVIYIAA